MFLIREEMSQHICTGKADCRSIYADALLVDAILEPDTSKVLRPALLPEAREWRKKLGLNVHEYTSEAT